MLEIKLKKIIVLTNFIQINCLSVGQHVLSISRFIHQEISFPILFYWHILESTSCVSSTIICDVILASDEIFIPLYDKFLQFNIDNVACQMRIQIFQAKKTYSPWGLPVQEILSISWSIPVHMPSAVHEGNIIYHTDKIFNGCDIHAWKHTKNISYPLYGKTVQLLKSYRTLHAHLMIFRHLISKLSCILFGSFSCTFASI